MDFGIELECLFPATPVIGLMSHALLPRVATGVARDITDAGVLCSFEGYTHRRSSGWKIVTDASVHAPSGFVGMELVSPPMTELDFPKIETVARTAIRLGAKTNKTCGFHVHIGAARLSVAAMRRLALLYIENEEVIDGLLPPSRRGNNNTFCQSVKSRVSLPRLHSATTPTDIARALVNASAFTTSPSRYTKLNFMSFLKHTTIEFRQHSGTIDPEKIIRWVTFCQKMVDIAELEDLPPPVIGTPRAEPTNLRRYPSRRRVYEMVARPEGATAHEVMAVQNRQTPPNIPLDLNRFGLQWYVDGKRGGHKVYKLRTDTVTQATLASLLEKLRLEEADASYWLNRARAWDDVPSTPSDLAE